MAPCSWSSRRCLKSLEILCNRKTTTKTWISSLLFLRSPSACHYLAESAYFAWFALKTFCSARSITTTSMDVWRWIRLERHRKTERETREKVITSSCSINRLARLLSSFIIIILAIFIWFSAFLCVIFIPWSLDKQKEKRTGRWLREDKQTDMTGTSGCLNICRNHSKEVTDLVNVIMLYINYACCLKNPSCSLFKWVMDMLCLTSINANISSIVEVE